MGMKLEDGTVSDACLDKVRPGEPIFVLRAQDLTAPSIIRSWLGRNLATLAPEKVQETRGLLQSMEEWQRAHPDLAKQPD